MFYWKIYWRLIDMHIHTHSLTGKAYFVPSLQSFSFFPLELSHFSLIHSHCFFETSFRWHIRIANSDYRQRCKMCALNKFILFFLAFSNSIQSLIYSVYRDQNLCHFDFLELRFSWTSLSFTICLMPLQWQAHVSKSVTTGNFEWLTTKNAITTYMYLYNVKNENGLIHGVMW